MGCACRPDSTGPEQVLADRAHLHKLMGEVAALESQVISQVAALEQRILALEAVNLETGRDRPAGRQAMIAHCAHCSVPHVQAQPWCFMPWCGGCVSVAKPSAAGS